MGEGMKTKDSARDDPNSAQSAGDEFGKIVARDVFDDFAAAASKRAVGERNGHADDEVAQRAEAQPKRATVVRGEDSANRCSFRPQRIECKTLAVLRERFL